MNLDEWMDANHPLASSAALVPAADGNPMQAAEAVAQARRNNIPPSLVGMQPDPDIARQNKIEDAAAAVRASPTLDEWLATQPPPIATSVMDDIHSMSAMGNLSRNYFVGKPLSGIYSLAGSVARFGEQAIPGATEEDITAVYRNDPTKMMQMISNPPAYQLPLVLAKLAREMQAKSEQADAAINPTQKAQYDSLRYATLDPSEAAYLSPGRVIGDVMQSLPSTAALMATVLLTRGAGMTAEKQALASGLTQAEARTAAIEAAMKMAEKSGAIGEGAVGFGQQYNDVFSQVYSSNLESSKEYSDLRGQGMDDAAARTYLASHAAMSAGLGAGVVDAVTNLVGGKYLGKIIGEGGNLLPRVARGFANEAATEAVQGAGEQLASNQALDAAGIPTDLLKNVGESAIAGLVVGGVTGGAFAGALGRSARNEADASQAMNTSRVLTELNKLAGATQIRDRELGTFESFLQSATEGTPLESVYIDASVLTESGVLNQLMEASPTVAEQMDQARGGTMIRIPVSEAIGRFHGELSALIPDMRTDPNGMTQREAEAYVAERGPALQAEVERILEEDVADTEAHDARLRVKDSVAQELMATGRMTKDVAEVYSTLTSTFYHVMGRRMGKNAEQLYGEERLRILGDGQGELGQSAQSVQIGERNVPITLDPIDARAGFMLAPVNAAAFDEAFKQAPDFYVGPQGEGGISNRYAGFGEFAATAASVVAPTVSVDAEGRVSFGNGRHRYAFMRDQGVQNIPMAMDAESLDNAVRYGYVSADAATNIKAEVENGNRIRFGRGRDSSRSAAPLQGAPSVRGATGPAPRVVAVAEQYAADNGIKFSRQSAYAEVDPEFAKRVADAYTAMPHDPNDPVVREAYENLARQTVAQYRALERAGYKFWFYDDATDPYAGNPMNAMRDLRANQSMAVYSTEAGFGNGEEAPAGNLMEADSGVLWPFGSPDGPLKRVLVNDLFRAVHDVFGHSLEGAGFRSQGEENAWQAHVRLYTGSAIAAITSETRGQNSWLNYGPFAEQNQTANVLDTVYAEQKTGLMPAWTWQENVVPDEEEAGGQFEQPFGGPETAATPLPDGVAAIEVDGVQRSTLNSQGQQIHPSVEGVRNFWRWFGDSITVDAQGNPIVFYHGTSDTFDTFKPKLTRDIGMHFGVESQAAKFGKNIMPAYLKIRNPLLMEDVFSLEGGLGKALNTIWNETDYTSLESDELIKYSRVVRDKWGDDRDIDNTKIKEFKQFWKLAEKVIRRSGFDGIVYRNEVEGDFDSYVAFNPTQIKSATGNRGTFGANDPNILHQFEQRRFGSFFSGARTLEAALGDIQSVLAVESDEAINEFANTSQGTSFVTRGIGDVSIEEIRDADIDHFHASPVCKNFSAAKTLKGATELDRESAEKVAQVIREVSPPVVTIENVPAYATTALFGEITAALDAAGYTWDVVIHDAADYGAAQTRKRMLLRAVKDGPLPPLPEAIGPSDWYAQVEDLLADAPDSAIPPVERQRLDDMIARGSLNASRPIITMGGSGFRNTWSAANAGGPAPTLKAAKEKPRIILPDGKVKEVTPRMMARLMGLPDSFPVPQASTLAKTVLGNGIHGDVTRALIAPLLKQGNESSSAFFQTVDRADRVRQMPPQIAATADVGNARTIATSRKWATNRDFKMAMQNAVLAVIGSRDLIEDTPTNRAYITQQLLKEAREALITNANAVGWYDEKVTTALEVLATIHPELKTDEQARFAFIWALAVTSNGVKVNKNFELAERAYSYWKANNNRLPTSGIGVGTAATRIHEGLKTYNDLIQRWGFERFRSFATTLQSNRDVEAEYGRKVSGEGMSTMVFGAGILGPKIGNGFFMNLHGEFGQLTMDRWWVRMWGRITGDLVETDPVPIRKSRDSLLALVDLIKADPEALRAIEQAIGAKLKKGDPIQTAKDITKATGSAEVRDRLNEILAATPEREAAVKAIRGRLTNFTSIGDELRKAAKNYLVYLDGQIEVPGGSKRRDMMRAVTTNVLTELQKDNPFLTMADLQALMWYPEKTLYESSGAKEDDAEGYNDDEAPDYANAAIKLAEEQGILNAEIEAAVGRATLDIEARQRARRSRRTAVGLSEQDSAGTGEVPGSEGSLAQQSRGSFSPAELTIRLTKAQNLSTFLHESGHFYLHMLASLASRADAPADIKTDADVVLDWLGVEASPERSRVDEWLSMSVDEQRDMHEKFARGFEGYLSDGKAPSVELAGMFAKFRSWLASVYRALLQGGSTDLGKALNAQLSPEVRAVFDRMLATEDEIRNAEISRSMGMMFASEAEAREYGVDWDAYQKQALAATDEAISAMDAKSIRDMKWLGNARSRLLIKLQREAKELRRVVRMGARAEVLAQPVYRAYQFLTGKLSAEDKLELTPGELRKSKPGPIDPTIDSLFVAIAKLGGLTREQVQSEWGIDPAENVPNALFGLPVVRASAGGALQAKSIDGMLESLAQFGYFPLDENERPWMADFEDAFDDELRGNKHYSSQYDPTNTAQEEQAGASIDLNNLGAARIDEGDLGILLRENDMPSTLLDELQQRRMVAKRGVHPELLAQQFGFSSGAELVEALAAAVPPKDAIEALTDQRMLEQHSDLATPAGREQAVTEALAGEARTRMVATELAALEKANKTGRGQQTLPAAAREFARNVISRLKVRDIRPGQYSGSASRSARAADKARKAGKVAQAALEKRNQLVNTYAARFASEALDEVTRGLAYLKKFANEGTRKNLDIDYLDQIDAILERYDLRKSTIKGLDKRKALSDWIAEQEADGLTPDLPAYIEDPRQRSPYQELTVEEFRGLLDSVKQIEHFARLKKRLLLAKDRREFAATVAEIEGSIDANAAKFGVKPPVNDTRTDIGGRLAAMFKAFTAAHRKFASLVYQMDGFADGPLWQALVRTANERGNWEATQQAKLTKRLAELMRGLKRTESPFSRGRYFSGIDMSLTHEQRLTVALNWGNEGNRQRLLDGRGWSDAGVQQVLATLTKGDWDFVQGVWDTFESLRPDIAEKERRLMGKEPNWVEAVPVQTPFGTFPGGYYPAVYDPRTNLKASENEDAEAIKRQLQGARSAATTRRNFVKARATEVRGRPLLLTMDGMFRGLSDVVHDLAIHEWAIDANRLLRALDPVIRQTYGADVINQLRSARDAIVAGEATVAHALDAPLRHIRIGSMVAGLGFNLVNSIMQPLGLTQSVVRIGGRWVAQGVGKFLQNPVALGREVMQKSEFMQNRARTQNRELNELRNRLRGKSNFRQFIDAAMFYPMTTMQLASDLPTWWGAYQKALTAGQDEDTAVQVADQAVIASQGGGQIKDLAAIQRGGEFQKLFTVFYGYFSTAYNLGAERYQQTNKKNPMEVLGLMGDFLMLYSVPAVLGLMVKEAFKGGGGDDDEELLAKLEREQLSYLFGLMVGVREAQGAAAMALGLETKGGMGYSGPAGLRFLQALYTFAQQANQGDADRALARAAVNVAGIALHLPSAQINRTIDGIIAISEGRTENPLALIGGAPPK